MDFFIYILRCIDKTLYVGQTNNIEKRIEEHKTGLVAYTSRKLPIELVYVQICQERKTAFALEQKIKKWSRRKKEALIKNNWAKLKLLSTKSFKK